MNISNTELMHHYLTTRGEEESVQILPKTNNLMSLNNTALVRWCLHLLQLGRARGAEGVVNAYQVSDLAGGRGETRKTTASSRFWKTKRKEHRSQSKGGEERWATPQASASRQSVILVCLAWDCGRKPHKRWSVYVNSWASHYMLLKSIEAEQVYL